MAFWVAGSLREPALDCGRDRLWSFAFVLTY